MSFTNENEDAGGDWSASPVSEFVRFNLTAR